MLWEIRNSNAVQTPGEGFNKCFCLIFIPKFSVISIWNPNTYTNRVTYAPEIAHESGRTRESRNEIKVLWNNLRCEMQPEVQVDAKLKKLN